MIRSPSTLSWKLKLRLIFLSLFSTFLVVEIGIRSYDAFRGLGFFSNHRNPLSTSKKPMIPFRTFGFELYKKIDGEVFISSRHGELYPLENSSHTFRIVCFGGSSTENEAVFNIEGIHYPLLLQSKLRERLRRDNIEVINVGYSAYATPHSIILLALDVLSWNPDLVILSHNVNDMLIMYWPDFTFDYSNKYSHIFFSVPNHTSLSTPMNVIFQHSQFYWFVRARIENLFKQKIVFQRKSYGNQPNPMAIKVFERNLRSFITLAKSNGIHVLLSTQPLQPCEDYFFRHMSYKPYNNVVVYPLHNEFVKHFSAYNQMTEKTAKDMGVFFIDNDQIMGGQKEYFIDFVHYSKGGVEELAQNYSDFIIANKIIRGFNDLVLDFD